MHEHATWEQIKAARMNHPAAQAGYEDARRAYELGRRVRELRDARGLSQLALSRLVGTSQPAIARLEAGDVDPRLSTLERLSHALSADLIVEFHLRDGAAAN